MNAKTKRRTLVVVAMLVLLATVLALSGATFARYITTLPKESNSATVAKWGFVLSADASDLFGKEYMGTGLATTTGTGTVNVAADTSVDPDRQVVAPGTTGSMEFSISGKAEVYAKLTITASGSDVSLTKGTETYNPVKWTLTKGSTALVTKGTLEEVLAQFNDGNVAEELAPNTPSDYEGDYVLTWEWAFEGPAESGITDLSGNAADTILGQVAENGSVAGYTAVTDISFSIEMQVEQIQK
jgi:hypothetical protein